MGDWYDFEIKIIDGKEISGFEYSNPDTGWNPVFVEMTEEQCEAANKWSDKVNALYDEKNALIKSWINGDNQ